MDDPASGPQHRHLGHQAPGAHRSQVPGRQLDRSAGPTLGYYPHGGLAHRRVDEGKQHPAVDRAVGAEVPLGHLHGGHHPAGFLLDQVEPEVILQREAVPGRLVGHWCRASPVSGGFLAAGSGKVQEQGLEQKPFVGVSDQFTGRRGDPSGGIKSRVATAVGGRVAVAAAEGGQPEPQLVVP